MLLKDQHIQVREAAALALREMGKGAVRAIPDLCAALRDPAPTVRMTAAAALGRIGEPTNSVVQAMAAALEVPQEDVQVLRNICYALGNLGPGARGAIPALQHIQHLRVRYIAEEAIARIEGRPVPTWH